MCCYSRRYDETATENISTENKSVMRIQTEIVRKNIELVTSFMLHYENYCKKDSKAKANIDFFIKTYRKIYVGVENIDNLKIFKDKIILQGIKEKDAYHLASAIFTNCDYFVTVDKKLLKYFCEEIKIINPVNFWEVYKNDNA